MSTGSSPEGQRFESSPRYHLFPRYIIKLNDLLKVLFNPVFYFLHSIPLQLSEFSGQSGVVGFSAVFTNPPFKHISR